MQNTKSRVRQKSVQRISHTNMPEETKQPNMPKQANIQGLISRASQIYDDHKLELEQTHKSKYVAIEADSGQYFIGETRDEAVAVAKKVFPNALMFTRRIGSIEKASRHNSYISSHARIL